MGGAVGQQVPPFAHDAELAAIIVAFDECTLPGKAWTHAAHLTVGTCAVLRLGPQAAFPYLRRGIRRLNESHGVVNSANGGYHETITWLYIAVIADLLDGMPAGWSRCDRVAAIITGPVDARAFGHYSRELIRSSRARLGFVDADLVPLPMRPESGA
jgi:hypothetical protein